MASQFADVAGGFGAGEHFEREAQGGWVVLAAEDFDGEGREPGKFGQLFIKLEARVLPFLVIMRVMNRAKHEDGHGQIGDGFAVAGEEIEGILV